MSSENTAKPAPLCGVLVVDKPRACTSHDVVSWARRAFSTREVGHAGTLDPMATGVLVVLVGEATKLSSWVTAEDKAYEADVRFGVETDSLDADGAVTRTVAHEPLTRDAIERECAAMVGPMSQVPPLVSAIKVDGVASHERARRGEAIELPPREVTLRSAIVGAVTGDTARVSLESSKGFYVRSFARDLAARLGSVAHLTSLRRTRSGAFSLADSVDGDRLRAARDDLDVREAVRAKLLPLRALEGRMPSVRVSLAQSLFLLQGRAIEAPEGCPEGVVLVFAEREDVGLPPQPLGLAERSESKLSPRRNFAPAALSSEWQPWLDGARSP